MNKKSEKAFKLHQRIVGFGRQVNTAFFELAGIFKTIRDEKIYKDLGYKSFQEYLAIPEMPYESSTIYAFIGVREKAQELGIKEDFFAEVSYAKFRVLIPHINEENKEELLSMARALSYKDLKHHFVEKKRTEGFKGVKRLPQVFLCPTCGKARWDALPDEICQGH